MYKPVAIVGISASLPSGSYSEQNLNHESFFDFLLNHGQSYETIPATRFDITEHKGPGLGQVSIESGSFLKDIDLFDHVEFGISTKDARALSPVARQLLQRSFLALLDSGIKYRRRPVGCYMSGSPVALPDRYEATGSFAALPAMIANKVSGHLDLLGPSIPVDTACSSGLTALHVAAQGLASGDCEAAIVGGCQLNHQLSDWFNYSQTGLLSSTGKSKPFDSTADGFGRAEGCVVIVIKLLEDALRDHDHIYATVLGSSVTSSGAGGPPGSPIPEAQAQAMKVAFARAGRAPNDVAYVELHATGTAKGDPTESNWVGQHFQRSQELLIGSVKGNIGHPEIASFLTSLSKVLSIFEHGIIPPNVNLSVPNPAIKWREYGLRVPTLPTLLPTINDRNRPLISISSFGIGGSNGHAVLEAPPPRVLNERLYSGPVLLMAGGLSPRSAAAIVQQISDAIVTAPISEREAISTLMGRRVVQMTWRSYAVLEDFPSTPIQFSNPQYCGRDTSPIVFVFSGQGPQHENMGRELFKMFPTFRESILDMDAIVQRKTNRSMIHDYGLFAGDVSSVDLPAVWPVELTLPAIAMYQMALFDLLVHLGVFPDLILGHSAGETAMLYASGAAPRAMAIELAIIRGKVFAGLETSGGTMAAISCGPEQIEVVLQKYRTDNPSSVVELACINSPSAVAISGQERDIDEILLLVKQVGILGRRLRTRIPFHSSMMEACREEYETQLHELFARYPGKHSPKTRTYSTLLGREFHGPLDAQYFWQNTRSQVLFSSTIQQLADVSTFVEIAPHPVLASYLSEVAPTSAVLTLARRARAGFQHREYQDLLVFLGTLTATGHDCVDFTRLNPGSSPSARFQLPPYPFLQKQFPLFPNAMKREYFGPINGVALRINRDTHPTLAEHVVRGEPIWPAAGFLEMALEFGARTLFDVEFKAILSLSADDPVAVDVTLEGSYWTVTTGMNRIHAAGHLSFEAPSECEDLNLSDIRSRCISLESDLYPSLTYLCSYGPKFQRATHVHYSSSEALMSIHGMDETLAREQAYILHPAILDACIHMTGYRPFHGDHAPNNYYLPSHVERMVLHEISKAEYFPSHVYSHVRLIGWTPSEGISAFASTASQSASEFIHFDIAIVDDTGKLLCTLRDFKLAKHSMSPLGQISGPMHLVNQPMFVESEASASSTRPVDEEACAIIQFIYTFGEELQLQWDLNGLNPSQALDIWISAAEGIDASAGICLTRALRREYPHWTIRFASFPAAFSKNMQTELLASLPGFMEAELDVIFSPAGDSLVPRLAPLQSASDLTYCDRRAVFNPDKTYVLVGGIGSLGAAVAVYMAQNGARHIVVTSRSGRETLCAQKHLISRRMFAYLESLEYLDIRLEAVDGASSEAMSTLFGSISTPLGGCLILSGILADGLFATLAASEFSNVIAAKTGVLTALRQAVDTSTFDFVVAFSSLTAIIGTPGQANYCAANGALEEQMRELPNGFSFICPGIIDSSMITSAGARTKYLLPFSISTDEMVLWLDDAIARFQQGHQFHRYLPNLDWNALDRALGMPKLGAHLIDLPQNSRETDADNAEATTDRIAQIIRDILKISEDDFDPAVPLTSYGMDSLSAGRLSFALRSMVEITQLQLLADISLHGIILKFSPPSSQ
ncbi:hypothetical protein FB45DRAFT_1004360 [Roridomyces roridus]|uniref:Polyketide synthase n=1 Tax=Roridomyces roridus TaxID=1738132 RepID=A0AAD7BRW3_9AGAR|nr:hypothetical protein FB45DRAFT_1004360 [Roridomyces roridus]